MFKFLKYCTYFAGILILSMLYVFYQADGTSDPFYKRFTSKKQTAMILGTSRAAQGILPEVLNEELGRSDLYNYSFTMAHSPYGPVYYQSILSKLQPSKEGLFILAVDPWSISSSCENPNDTESFRENELALGKTSFVNWSFNLEYLIESYSEPYIELLLKSNDHTLLHDDGWLEVSLKMDSTAVEKRKARKMEEYLGYSEKYKYSHVRLKYLDTIIKKLKMNGEVYLVRLPVCNEIIEIENHVVHDFNGMMDSLAKTNKIPYFDFTDLSPLCQFTDGNHLYKKSAESITDSLAKSIMASTKQ